MNCPGVKGVQEALPGTPTAVNAVAGSRVVLPSSVTPFTASRLPPVFSACAFSRRIRSVCAFASEGRRVPVRGCASKTAGWTLVELMVALVLLVVVAGMAIPSFTELNRSNQMTTAANEVLHALQTARHEAASRGRTVTACASSNGQSCDGNWGDGWMVFVNTGLQGGGAPADIGEILRIGESSTVVTTRSGAPLVSFGGTGEVVLGAGTIELERPGCGPGEGRQIRVTAGGSAGVSSMDC